MNKEILKALLLSSLIENFNNYTTCYDELEDGDLVEIKFYVNSTDSGILYTVSDFVSEELDLYPGYDVNDIVEGYCVFEFVFHITVRAIKEYIKKNVPYLEE